MRNQNIYNTINMSNPIAYQRESKSWLESEFTFTKRDKHYHPNHCQIESNLKLKRDSTAGFGFVRVMPLQNSLVKVIWHGFG